MQFNYLNSPLLDYKIQNCTPQSFVNYYWKSQISDTEKLKFYMVTVSQTIEFTGQNDRKILMLRLQFLGRMKIILQELVNYI